MKWLHLTWVWLIALAFFFTEGVWLFISLGIIFIAWFMIFLYRAIPLAAIIQQNKVDKGNDDE